MVKVSRFAVNPQYPTMVTEGFEQPPTATVMSVNIAIPVSESGFMVSYPYMDYNRGSVNYATLSHIVPTDLPNPINNFVKDSILYNRMLEDRIKKAQNMYYQEVATAINNSPTLSKMNVPVSSPIEGFEYIKSSSMNRNMKMGMFIVVLGVILAIGYVTLKKKD